MPPAVQGLATALLVLSVLIPSESVASGTGAALASAWLLCLAGSWGLRGQGADSGPWTRLELGILLLGGWIALSSGVMAWQGNPRATLNVAWQWASLLASFVIVRREFRQPGSQRALGAVMVAVAAGSATHGLYQFALSMPHHRQHYRSASEPEKQRMLREAGIEPQPGSPERWQFEDRLDSTEPYATFGLANSLAGLLAAWLVFAAGQLAGSPANLARRGLQIAWLALMLLGLVLTKSRSAWLAALVGGAVAAYPFRHRFAAHRGWFAALAGVMVVATTIGLLAGALDVQVLTQAWLSLRYRAEYWWSASGMVWDHPWFGCGPGNFQEYYTQYKLPTASETVADPHNLILELAATCGMPAAILFAGLLGGIGSACWLAPPAHDEPPASDNADQDAPWPIYLGALAGFLLAVPYGWLIGYPPETDFLLNLPIIWLVSFPAAAGCLWTLRTWVRTGSLATVAVLAAWLTLAINLLAAGGISYPGVGLSFWLLGGLAAVPRAQADLPRATWLVGIPVTLALLAASILSGYLPVVRARTPMLEATFARNLAVAEQHLRAATLADPSSPEPWRLLADLELARWQQTRDPARHDAWENALAEARKRNRHSQSQAVHEGQSYLASYRTTGYAPDLERALSAFQRAAELYPHGGFVRAQLAWSAHLAAQDERARNEAERALQLDSQNAHREQKLDRRTIPDPGPATGTTGQRPGPPPGGNAEQLMRELRTGARAHASSPG